MSLQQCFKIHNVLWTANITLKDQKILTLLTCEIVYGVLYNLISKEAKQDKLKKEHMMGKANLNYSIRLYLSYCK